MPENQNEWGESWNQQLNNFLRNIMHWDQMGVSNIDITDPVTGKQRGLDTVFSYKRNPFSTQEIILVEAKTVEKFQSLSKNKLEVWVSTLLDKLGNLPYSEDFQEVYQPETDAVCNYGLIGLWVRETSTYSETQLQEWLSKLYVPTRRKSYFIGLVSNRNLNLLYAINREVERLRTKSEYQKVEPFFPYYGDKPKIEGSSFPFETFFSKFIFYHATKLQTLRGNGKVEPYSQNIVFYLGDIQNYDDLAFIGEAMLRFNLFHVNDAAIYILENHQKLRGEIELFHKNYKDKAASCTFEFKQLILSEELPFQD